MLSRDEIIAAAMPAAKSFALRRTRGCPRMTDDAIASAYLGLVEAYELYDPGRGARFTTFAWMFVRRRVADCIRSMTTVAKFGLTQEEKNAYVAFVRASASGRSITAEEMSAATAMPVERCRDLIALLSGGDVPVSHVSRAEGELELRSAFASPEDAAADRERSRKLRASIAELSLWKRQVIERATLSDGAVTLADIGKEWSRSRERIRQIEAAAIEELRMKLAG